MGFDFVEGYHPSNMSRGYIVSPDRKSTIFHEEKAASWPTYNDTYRYTLLALKKYGSSLQTLLSRRFQYAFVDEYQDCSTLQRDVLDALFSGTETIFQKIGDVDQAIYNSTKIIFS